MRQDVIERKEVTRTGNGAHVLVPKDWLGKKVKVEVVEE